jgi:integrase
MKVFISSTSEDLKPFRLAAADVVRDAQWQPIGMEHFPADPRPIIQLCHDILDGCELVLLLQAWRYGWVPTVEKGGDGEASITALEIAAAEALPRPVLAFLADDNWPGRLWDDDATACARAKNFRGGLNRNAKFFHWENDPKLPAFRALLSQELANYRNRGAVSQPQPPAIPAVTLRVVPADTSLPSEPYPLLDPYKHPRTFAGRDAEVTALAELVGHSALVLCVHAASGAGKSSLLLAGLAPHLRADGYIVSIDRAPGDPRLGQRLLRDILEPSEAVALGDDDVDLPATFARRVAQAHVLSGKPIVFVLDQIDDVLRNAERRDQALARIGPLMAATAERLPGVQAFPCKWVLCYRHEFHGEVRAWLEDVLAQARTLDRKGLESLPFDLSDTQKSHDWVLPVMGKPRPGERALDASKFAFLRAIVQPLEQAENGRPCYRYRMPSDGADRLATVFAQARQKQPDAPLVPELQVLLGHLLQQARERASTRSSDDAALVVQVPADEQLKLEIGHALAQHVERALNSAFPDDRETATGRSARTKALMALRQLADAEGRRGQGLPEDELIRMIGPEGERVLTRLSAADTRLVVVSDGRCVLSHDRLAEVIAEIVTNEASRGNLCLDDRLLNVQRIVGQKLALYQSDASDHSALLVGPQHLKLITANQDILLFDEPRRAWWTAAQGYHRQLKTRRNLRIVLVTAVTAVVLLASSLMTTYVSRTQAARAFSDLPSWTEGKVVPVTLVTTLPTDSNDGFRLLSEHRVWDLRRLTLRNNGNAIVSHGPVRVIKSARVLWRGTGDSIYRFMFLTSGSTFKAWGWQNRPIRIYTATSTNSVEVSGSSPVKVFIVETDVPLSDSGGEALVQVEAEVTDAFNGRNNWWTAMRITSDVQSTGMRILFPRDYPFKRGSTRFLMYPNNETPLQSQAFEGTVVNAQGQNELLWSVANPRVGYTYRVEWEW